MNPIWFLYLSPFGCFLKWWVSPTTIGFPTNNDPFGVWNGGTPIFGNTHLYLWHPLTKLWIIPSFPTKHQPVYRGIAWSWFRASVLRQFAQALWVLPHLHAIFKGNLKFPAPTTTNNNQQPTPTPNPKPANRPTNKTRVVRTPRELMQSFLHQTTPPGIACRCRKTFAKMIKGLLLFCLLLQVFHQVIHVGSLENMYKVFQQTLFWGFLLEIKNSPNQSSLLRQVEVFFLMILPAPPSFQLWISDCRGPLVAPHITRMHISYENDKLWNDVEHTCMYFCLHFIKYIYITSLIITVLSQYKRLLFIIKLLIPRFPLHKTTFPIPIRQNFWITVRCNQRSTGSAFWSKRTADVPNQYSHFAKDWKMSPLTKISSFPSVQKREHWHLQAAEGSGLWDFGNL